MVVRFEKIAALRPLPTVRKLFFMFVPNLPTCYDFQPDAGNFGHIFALQPGLSVPCSLLRESSYWSHWWGQGDDEDRQFVLQVLTLWAIRPHGYICPLGIRQETIKIVVVCEEKLGGYEGS